MNLRLAISSDWMNDTGYGSCGIERMKLPKGIKIYRNTIRFVEAPIRFLGEHDPQKMTVTINPNMPETGKHIVVIHELMHVIETLLIRNGIMKRRVNHEFITNAPAALLHIMIKSGMYTAITSKQFTYFMRKYGRKLPARTKKKGGTIG